MLRDLGVDISKNTQIAKAVPEVRIDASAGRGTAARRGAGRIRHITTPTFWVQKLTQDGKVKITTIFGESNPADLRTKHLDGGSIFRALEKCHCHVREGRSGLALRAEEQEITRQHPDVFTLDTGGLHTQSQTDLEFGQH